MESSLINHLFYPLLDKPCWHVQLGYGSFLTLEFGMPKLIIDEPTFALTTSIPARRVRTRRVVRVRGEWHLWIYSCHWRVTRFDRVIGDSSTAQRRKRAAQELDGQILTHVVVRPQNGASIFRFDLGAQLETVPYDQESEQWLLYEPTGEVFTVRADGCYSHMPGDTPQGQERWHQLPCSL
jgi:hypothetical protein